MKLNNLVNPQFFSSFNKVMRAEIPVTLAWKLKGLAKHLEDHHTAYDDMRKELLNKYSLKHEDGSPKVDTSGNVVFESDEAKDKFIDAHKELLQQEIEIDTKIKIGQLSGVKLSASDLLVLEDLLEE